MPRRSIAALLLGELAEERIALLGAEPADATARGDVEALHDLARPDLPHTRERFQNRGHLHLSDGVVALAGQHVGERELARLELALELRPLPPCLGGLLEGLLALFLRQDGKRHDALLLSVLRTGAGNPGSIDTAVRASNATYACSPAVSPCATARVTHDERRPDRPFRASICAYVLSGSTQRSRAPRRSDRSTT